MYMLIIDLGGLSRYKYDEEKSSKEADPSKMKMTSLTCGRFEG
jgi:hypothetical protein